MASANAPKVLSIRIEPSENESVVVYELGTKTIRKQIPSGQGFMRSAIILDSKTCEIADIELVLEKT